MKTLLDKLRRLTGDVGLHLYGDPVNAVFGAEQSLCLTADPVLVRSRHRGQVAGHHRQADRE